jgi:hypothetical protein
LLSTGAPKKNFFLREIDWLISFPCSGNEGRKYANYTVDFFDLKTNKTNRQIPLFQVIDSPIFDQGYPHTVCLFRGDIKDTVDFHPDFLEMRIVNCIEEFWKFLNDLNI